MPNQCYAVCVLVLNLEVCVLVLNLEAILIAGGQGIKLFLLNVI